MSGPGADALALLDWRRRVSALYAQVRGSAEPAAGHAAWVAGRRALNGDHPASPRPGAVTEVAPYDPTWRFGAALEPAPAERLDVPTATDGVVPFERVGRVRLVNADRDAGSLDVWALRSYGGGIFVPVKDATAGRGSYGGGRYLLDTVKGADLGGDPLGAGTLVLDLNFAYNPSCAYDPAWACPLAPPGNVLPVPVPVGEQEPR